MKTKTIAAALGGIALLILGTSTAFGLGNTTAQEYGDAVYRKLYFPIGPNYNHAGLFAGQSGGVKRCIEADTLTGDTTKDNSFSGSFSGYGSDYYGAYTLDYGTPSFSDRKTIMATAKQVADAYIYYTYINALDPITSTRPVTTANIDNLRCDGVVEYCYEYNNYQSWWHTSYPSRWQISMFPEEHNDAPDLSVEPGTEESPWAQRGAPPSSSEGPGSYPNPNNARLTRPAVIAFPTYLTPSYSRINATTIDVTITATDASGIAYIGYKMPGSSTWSYTSWQAQHPTSASYAYVIRITSAGTLYYFAEDNGGNFPASAPGVSFYTVSSSAGSGGTISPSGSVLVPYGQSYAFTASPNANYTVDKWYVDGSAVQTGGNSYTLSNVQANRSVQVTFKLNTISVTVQTSPSGRSFSVDGTTYTSSQTFNWTPGSSHTIATTSPQSGSTGVQYTWSSWSDGGAMSHSVSPTSPTTYTANFKTQYYLTMNAGMGGTVSPSSGWYDSSQSVQINATANGGYTFNGWTGSGSGSYSGMNNPANVTMNGPITEAASFAANPVLSHSPSSLTNSVMKCQNATNQTFEVWNSGGGTLSFTNTVDQSWLWVSPTNSTSTGGHDTIQVSYSTAGLDAGTNYATITIKSQVATDTIPVTLTVLPPIPFTFTTNDGTITITGYTGPGGAVNIPSTISDLPVSSIGSNAFYYCTSLTSVTIPNSVTSIGDFAFFNCYNMTNVTIPNNVTSIGKEAFAACEKLMTGVTIPNSVTNIGYKAFSSCASLSAITVYPLNYFYSSVDGVLFNKSTNALIQCPGGKAGSYTVPNGVTSIGDLAFSDCASLTSVTIPNSVTSIGGVAFYYCTGLTGVYFQGNAPSMGTYVFYKTTNATIYCLPGTAGWNPQVQTSGDNFGIQTNRFGFSFTRTKGLGIVVDACTNLANPTWAPLETNNIFTSDASYFSDPMWTNYSSRFYRAWSQTFGNRPIVLWNP
ncbi:MAG: leucine-rich repeat protein [Verrucomicrobia bacterium]|jgi:hypothetical protein|nr:leucine-rich repeat protein [Verrucomicrobiota bacterium]